MTNMKQPSDYPQRQQALDPTQSFICEAPAGSGKTELLTQRVLKLLTTVSKPEQILAITFTRKAAGEMRDRVFKAIQSGQQPKPLEPHKIQTWQLATQVLEANDNYQWHLLENPNRLQIKTFDSLCASLANSLPLESSFGAKPQVSEDSEELYRKAARALLHSLEEDAAWTDGLSVLLGQLDNRYGRLEDLLISMLARREEWAPLINYQQDRDNIHKSHANKTLVRNTLEQSLKNIIQDTLNQAAAHIPANLHKDIVNLAGYAAANLQKSAADNAILACSNMELEGDALPPTHSDYVPQWQGICDLLVTGKGNKGDWRKSFNVNCGFPTSKDKEEKAAFDSKKKHAIDTIEQLKSVPGLLELLKDIRQLPNPTFNHHQWQLLDALFEVLPVLVAQLTLVFTETNQVDFSEISIRARQALGLLDDPTQLALKLDYQIQHILVDEFQDTSHSQVELLQQLTAGWQLGDGRTLFCVGDAMQSIYGFRGANVGLFLHCREQGLENVALTPLKLCTNFRSQGGVVEWVNKTFQRAFPDENDISRGAVVYSESEPFHTAHDNQSVYVHGFLDRDDNLDEAETALQIIKETRTSTPEQSIAILVRSRDQATAIAQRLKHNGLKYRAVDLEPLQNHSIIQDLMALTQALLHPADRKAWLAVLRAPWCGLSLMDLEAIANVRIDQYKQWPPLLKQAELALDLSTRKSTRQDTATQSDLFATESAEACIEEESIVAKCLTDDGIQRLRRVLPILTTALQEKERKPFRSWIEGSWISLGGPVCLQQPVELTNALMYLQLLESWPYSTDLPSLEHLTKAVKKLFAAPDPEADDKIQIMTIHKSKGLEFDVVIVPGLQKRPRSNSSQLLMWHQRINGLGEMDLVMSPITAVGSDKHPTQTHLQSEEAKKAYFESCRLLYVARTRAKHQLHLMANLEHDEKSKTLKAPAATSLMHSIWPAVQLQVIKYNNERAVVESKEPLRGTPLRRLTSDWQLPALPVGDALEAFIPRYQYNNEDNTQALDWKTPSSRYVGTLIHRYMQLICDEGFTAWPIERVKQSQQQIMNHLKSLGTPSPELKAATDKVSLALTLVLQDKKSEELLSNKHSFSASEFPITFNSRVGPKNLVIDRIYTDRWGTTWVVDYKTATPSDKQSLEAFLQQQRENYEPQLKLYQTALQQAGFKKVKTALYFPLLTHWLAIDNP
ncbi:MAG: UvrD-helicase domain-containing protein [Pseudomonadales bacterium]|nr:UvrD-helicase domain-containing protein [Pseudomonadales bacterium]